MKLAADDKDALLKAFHSEQVQPTQSPAGVPATSAPRNSLSVTFPHPVQNLESHKAELKLLYAHLSKGLVDFFEKLALWDESTKTEREAIHEALKSLPDAALACYEAQYAELAMQFEDFAVWANLHEHKATRQVIDKLSSYVQQRAALAAKSSTAIDVGFAKVQAAVSQIPRILESTRATDIVAALQRHYDARVNEPIIEDKYETEEGKPRLSFPKIKDAFIPQSYRAIVYTSKIRRLEAEDTWQPIQPRQDLGAFLLSYLSSPYSTENPLIILGHPGSGKSLLTNHHKTARIR